ncbi:MAG: hypothetical protein JWO96_830 [Candidatus Saccharibacteria bacterium]|nr:hypothetical protein [Candidatus Saccharibacteria bacterium]
MEFNWLQAIGLFFASLALDAVFALYTIAVIKSKALHAAYMSVLTYVLGAVGIVSYVHNKWYIVPLSAGAFTGSYAIVKYEAVKNARKS